MSTRTTRPATRRGFTFVELVVVISIIAALAAIGFPVWGMISNRVKVNATDALVNSVATAITTYQTKTWTWNVGTTAAPSSLASSRHRASSTAADASAPRSTSIRTATEPSGRTAQPPTTSPRHQTVGPTLPKVS